MKKEFDEYLKIIGLEKPLIDKVEQIYNFYEPLFKFHGEKIDDIFVSEYLKDDGERVYENLWFFSKYLSAEAKNFISNRDDFDMITQNRNVLYYEIYKEEYDFKNYSDKSLFKLEAKYGFYNRMGELKASKENCDYLKNIFFKYFASNLRLLKL